MSFTNLSSQQKLSKENELLEIFILLEENTTESSKEAATRYQKLYSITRLPDAYNFAKTAYNNYLRFGKL